MQAMPSNLIYPSGPPYSGYGPSMPTLHTSAMTSVSQWQSGSVLGGQHAANVINASSPPLYGAPSAHSPQLSVSVVIDAIRSQNATQKLDKYWKDGHALAVATAFAQGATQKPAALSGKPHLNLVLDLVSRNNNQAVENPAVPKDSVARDLCVAIGAMAMNTANPIDKPTALAALPVALSTMQANNCNAAVYWSSCFAMSNLLKICNVIEDPTVRKDVAVWIVHAISWNLSRGTKLDALAYTAASAARNYMWLNEANAATFLSKEEKIFNASPLRKLLTSLSYFRQHDQPLEASLSALAMIAYFPAHRPEVIANQGVKMLLDILRHCVQRPHAACLCLSILGVLVSDPGAPDARSPTRAALLADGAPDAVIGAVFYATRAPGRLQIEEEALASLTSLCEFDEEVLAASVNAGAVSAVNEALRGFGVQNLTLIHSALRTSCAIQMCEAAYALAKSAEGLARLRETEALKYLKTIKTLFRENEQLVGAAAKVISLLSG